MSETTYREMILESALAEAKVQIEELQSRWEKATGTKRWCPECRIALPADMQTHRHATLRQPYVNPVEPWGPPVMTMMRQAHTECATVPLWVGNALLCYPDAARAFVANLEAK